MAPSRGLCLLFGQPPHLRSCRSSGIRTLTSTTTLRSGHNRWSKIKHDKGKADAAKNRQRSIFSQEIAMASRMFGPEPNLNPRLAGLITKAKKEGFAKSSIEAAVARGQGRSLSGAALENVTVEGILPNNVAVIVECETDNRLRTLQEVRLVMKQSGGTASPSSYLFEKRGRITFEPNDAIGVEEALESAIEAGATDVGEDEHGALIVSAEPGNTKVVGEAVANALGLAISTSEILWDPNEDTKIGVPDENAALELSRFVDELQDKETSVQAVAMNVAQGNLDDDSWKHLQSRLSA